MNSTPTKQLKTINLTRQNLETENSLNTMEKGGSFLDTTFKITGYRKRRLSKLPAPVIIPTPPIIISCSPNSEQNSPKTPQSPTKRFVLKPISALTAAFQRTTITSRKSTSPMTLLKFPKSLSNNNSKSPKPISSPQSPKPPKSPKLLHRKGSSGSIRKRSESPTTNSVAAVAVAATYLSPNNNNNIYNNNNNNNNGSQSSLTNNNNIINSNNNLSSSSISSSSTTTTTKNNNFRFCKSLPSSNSTNHHHHHNLPKSPSKLGSKFNLKSQQKCRKALPILPSELADRLRESFSISANEENLLYYYDKPFLNRLPKPILIDVRNLSLYQDDHIRDSFNVNLPTLLIKRYRRGNMSNFSLDSFITIPEDRDKYLDVINEDGGKYHHDIIIFDENMDENDKVSPGWTLLNVLERVMLSYHPSNNSSDSIDEINNDLPRGRVYWLKGGFEAFKSWDQRNEFIVKGPDSDSNSDKDDGNLMECEGQDQQGTNLVRRDSLFSVNTERNSLRRKKSVKQPVPNLEINSQPPPPPLQVQQQPQQPPQLQLPQLQQQQQQRQQKQLSLRLPSENKQAERRPSNNGLQNLFTSNGDNLYPTASYGVHDFPNNDSSLDTPPPVTHPEIAFEVSTIIPGFLFLGPEITKEEEVKELEDKGVRRILNMAFECNDSLSLKDKFDRYLKLNVRDSVEENVEKGLKIAVNFIERAQEDNTPIYVHCRAGKSRSVTAVLAYLIKSRHWTLKHAYDYVMERRNEISPNIGFVAELMRLEEDVFGFKRNGGVVTSIPSKEKEEIMEMEGVEPLNKPKTAFF